MRIFVHTRYHVIANGARFRIVFRLYSVSIQILTAMAFQKFSAEQITTLLDSSTVDSDDNFSDDEIVGDFSADDGRARVLHGEVLQHVSQHICIAFPR